MTESNAFHRFVRRAPARLVGAGVLGDVGGVAEQPDDGPRGTRQNRDGWCEHDGDAPIYVGQHAEPPDKVIADVQALLQQMGYYTGEVDGLLGPMTREALTAYQTDQGLTATAVIDQPTLDSLGKGTVADQIVEHSIEERGILGVEAQFFSPVLERVRL